ncbi:MAG: GNAT family N-acetyltransferase [Methylobacter sp.]|nr:MAG: GNAT family N-acetyltransferase [Methylobacter sp.]
MQQIHDWLQEEDAQEVYGNFLCNWNLTQQCHEEGTLLVLIDVIEGIPVAYQWSQLLRPGILQVRNDWRGKGLGRLIVQYCIELALQQDEMVLEIECKPSSSIPFWEAMGFTIIKGEFGETAKGFKVLSKELALPPGGRPALVTISSFPEESKWREGVPAIVSYRLDAIFADDEKVHLSERASFPKDFRRMGRDPVIEIIVDDKLIFRDKAKYQTAQAHGVKWCRNGFYIDAVTI